MRDARDSVGMQFDYFACFTNITKREEPGNVSGMETMQSHVLQITVVPLVGILAFGASRISGQNKSGCCVGETPVCRNG